MFEVMMINLSGPYANAQIIVDGKRFISVASYGSMLISCKDEQDLMDSIVNTINDIATVIGVTSDNPAVGHIAIPSLGMIFEFELSNRRNIQYNNVIYDDMEMFIKYLHTAYSYDKEEMLFNS